MSLFQHKNLDLTRFKGKKILAISAIGNPKAFENTLTLLGAHVVGTLRLQDHSGSADKVKLWIGRNRRHAEWILMTEKDAMRWGFGIGREIRHPGLPAEAYALRMDLIFSGGEDHWRKLIALVKRLAQHEKASRV